MDDAHDIAPRPMSRLRLSRGLLRRFWRQWRTENVANAVMRALAASAPLPRGPESCGFDRCDEAFAGARLRGERVESEDFAAALGIHRGGESVPSQVGQVLASARLLQNAPISSSMPCFHPPVREASGLEFDSPALWLRVLQRRLDVPVLVLLQSGLQSSPSAEPNPHAGLTSTVEISSPHELRSHT